MKSGPSTISSSSRKITQSWARMLAAARPMLRMAPYPRRDTGSPGARGAIRSTRSRMRTASRSVRTVTVRAGWERAIARTRSRAASALEGGLTTSTMTRQTSRACSSEARQASSSGLGAFRSVLWS